MDVRATSPEPVPHRRRPRRGLVSVGVGLLFAALGIAWARARGAAPPQPPTIVLVSSHPSPAERSAVWCPLMQRALRCVLPPGARGAAPSRGGGLATDLLRDLDAGDRLPTDGVSVSVRRRGGPWVAAAGPSSDVSSVLPRPDEPRPAPDELEVRAAFHRSVRFTAAFEALETPLAFRPDATAVAATPCRAFGWTRPPGSLGGPPGPAELVDLLFREHGELAIAIPSADGDEVVIASVPYRGSLAQTWDAVAARAARGARTPLSRVEGLRRLAIPEIRLDVSETCAELEGAVVDAGGDLRIVSAEETIGFRLDRTGAVVAAKVSITMRQGSDPPVPVDLGFDRPFLLALRARAADSPYVLLWVADAGVFVRSTDGAERSLPANEPRR